MFIVHLHFDKKEIITLRMPKLPRTGDSLKFDNGMEGTVTKVVWLMERVQSITSVTQKADIYIESNPIEKEFSLIQKLDTDKPGTFVCRMTRYVPIEKLEAIHNQLSNKFELACPGSTLIILGPEFEEIKISKAENQADE